MGRPKGSKNKTSGKVKSILTSTTFNSRAEYFAKSWIAVHGIDGAEKLAERVWQKILANKIRLSEENS